MEDLMRNKVRCYHCGGTYDLGKVEVTGRYTDCSVWKAPCCGRTVDDRPWPHGGHYREVKGDSPYDDDGYYVMDDVGVIRWNDR